VDLLSQARYCIVSPEPIKESDGLISNDFLGAKADFHDTENLRTKLRWLAISSLSLDFIYNTSHSKQGAFYDSGFTDTERKNANTYLNPTSNVLGKNERRSDDFTVKVRIPTHRDRTFQSIVTSDYDAS